MENPVRVAIRDSTENLVNIPLQAVDERGLISMYRLLKTQREEDIT